MKSLNWKWIHIDSTLEYPVSFNHPYYYEQNWGKKYEYVLAFSASGLEDVTRNYTQHWQTDPEKKRKEGQVGRIRKVLLGNIRNNKFIRILQEGGYVIWV